jgi:cytidylate kinase
LAVAKKAVIDSSFNKSLSMRKALKRFATLKRKREKQKRERERERERVPVSTHRQTLNKKQAEKRTNYTLFFSLLNFTDWKVFSLVLLTHESPVKQPNCGPTRHTLFGFNPVQ